MEKWKQLSESFNNKNQRERLIIAALLLAVIWSLINFAFVMPIDKAKTKLEARKEKASQELKKMSAQESVLTRALSNDPNAEKKIEIRNLEGRLKELDKSLQTLSVGLISADDLPQALHDVLRSTGSLSLLGMKTLAPTRLALKASESSVDASLPDEPAEKPTQEQDLQNQQLGVFKHSVEMALEGRYFDVVTYLKALEALPWKIYWERIDYQVGKYPKARVLIEVYTLSTEQGVLGV